MKGYIIPEEDEKSIGVQQENATFLVIGDKAYTSEIIEEYNNNAEAKTMEFNTNATNQTNNFNDNVATKTKEFNNNVDTKTTMFDNNAETKITEYNTNATTKEESFNSLVNIAIQDYDTNAQQKLYEFNQNASSYQEGIEENANDISDVSNRVYRIEKNLYDSGIASGDVINIEDCSYSEFQNVSIDGAISQKRTTGQQLYNVNDKNQVFEGITVDDDGWITINVDNTSGQSNIYANYYTNNLDLKAATDYNVFLEVKSISGDGNIRVLSYFYQNDIQTQGQFNTYWNYDFNQLQSNKIYNKVATTVSKEIMQNIENDGLRTFVEFPVGKVGSITFRLSVIEDTEKTAEDFIYEPYTGGNPSPNPEYPQDIKTIEEGFNLITCGQNLYNVNDKSTGGINSYNSAYSVDEDGWVTLNIENEPSDVAYYNLFSNNLNLKPDTYYNVVVEINQKSGLGTLSIVTSRKEDNVQAEGQFVDNFSDTFGNFSSGIYVKKLKTLNKEQLDNTVAGLRSYIMLNKGAYSSITFRISVIEDISVTSDTFIYEPYQSLKTFITLPEKQFVAKISNNVKDQFILTYNEKDANYHLYLNKRIGKVIFNGTEDGWWLNESNQFRIQLHGVISWGKLLSNRFIDGADYKPGDMLAYTDNYILFISDKLNVEDWKTWLQSNNVVVYYELAEMQTIDLGTIQMPLTYCPVTNVSTDCPLLPNITVAYYRDFKATIEAMQTNITENNSLIHTLEEQVQAQTTTISSLEGRISALEQTESEVVE